MKITDQSATDFIYTPAPDDERTPSEDDLSSAGDAPAINASSSLTKIGDDDATAPLPKFLLVMMTKNETKRIRVTIESIRDKGFAGVAIFDTGSEDDTLDIIEDVCVNDLRLPVHVRHGKFVNFTQGYDTMLDVADDCAVEHGYDFYVILDANDEFVGELPRDLADDVDSWFIERRLKWSTHDVTRYWNLKLLRARKGQRYVGDVHEYLDASGGATAMCDSFHIFQDRTLDDDKSAKRYFRDRPVLERELEAKPNDPRLTFYLAQTYSCIDEPRLAYDTYAKRATMTVGYAEERWQAAMQCAKFASFVDGVSADERLAWLQIALRLDARVETANRLCEFHLDRGEFAAAYAYARLAADLPWPRQRMLFIEQKEHEYTRWHLLGRAAYYYATCVLSAEGTDDYRERRRSVLRDGETGCSKAIAAGCDVALDESNLAFYLVV